MGLQVIYYKYYDKYDMKSTSEVASKLVAHIK